jgi:membrane protein implicated in regulation of membrane protease activity
LVQFEYINTFAGLAMLIIGLFLMLFGYWTYGIAPVAVGVVLIAIYRKYLLQILGTAY